MERRVVSLWLPTFATDRLSRLKKATSDWQAKPLATIDASHGGFRIAAVNHLAEEAGIHVHVEVAPLKRDFVNLVRVEAVIGDERHGVTGTVLGHRHSRLVELDQFLMDAIPEGPALVTFHEDRPGVLGKIGTVLGRHAINISRMQLGDADGRALGIWNLSQPMSDAAYADVQALSGIEVARAVI